MLGPAMPDFKLNPAYSPTADQPRAIESIAEGLEAGEEFVTLLGATGTGKTFTMAATIERVQRPALVIAHNKTLAAQLCNEFREFFPDNVVEYFVSYYDYYQPEAYVPHQDLYIEKDSSINDEIDRLTPRRDRLAAGPPRRRHRRLGLMHLRDRLAGAVPAPDAGRSRSAEWIDRHELFRKLVGMQYTRNETRAHPRHLPGPWRDARDLPRLRRVRVSRQPVRRRDRRRSTTSTR